MVNKAACEVFTLVINDKLVRSSAIIIVAFTCFLGIFFSPLAGIILCLCYLSGYVTCWCLIRYQRNASLALKRLISFCRGRISSKSKIRKTCSICDDLSCKRHDYKSHTPWKGLYIQEDLNEALEEFYDRIIENFVSSWYGYITDDADFLDEVRYCLRYTSASVINRFVELDVTQIISNKLLPCAVKHIDDYLYMQQIAKLRNSRFNDIIVEYLGKRLHSAVTNRKNELNYLQYLTSSLLPHILPEKYLKCRNFSVLVREILAGWVFLPLMDVLADPNIINSLIVLITTYKSKRTAKTQHFRNVQFLCNFAVPKKNKVSSFTTDLNHIKKDTDLLYAFMQFLKREAHVHLLHFCLDVDHFNNKLLTPDLNKKQLEDLYTRACKLYKEYLDKESLTSIDCPENIVNDFRSLLDDGVYNVAKLRTSKPLFQAYEHTFNVLENCWLPIFFKSNEFYNYICGSKVTAVYNKAAVNKNRKYYEATGQGTVSRISNSLVKIRGALRVNNPIDGAFYPSESASIENGTVDDIIITDSDNIIRDLSTWRVSITSYQTCVNKTIIFCINVQRLDAITNEEKRQWMVFRKDQDFYTLKAKLIEFHGENEICDSPLPSRKSGNTVDVRMHTYESFLRKLLQKPSLRGSDLLYTFLTAVEDFTFLIVTSAPVVQDLGNIYQSVAHKLRKERGQHLDSFMATFLASTDATKHSKFEWAEIGDEAESASSMDTREPPLPKTYRNHVFNDNFGIDLKSLKDTSSTPFNPVGITECLFYILKHVLKIHHNILRFYAALCSVARNSVDSICRLILDHKLKTTCCQSNLAYLIRLLEGVIFDHYPTPTKTELEKRKEAAFNGLKKASNSLVTKVLGTDIGEGLTTILDMLQHPHYNKQLMYSFLDLLLVEMYPSLVNSSDKL